jgi:hypothetical protein
MDLVWTQDRKRGVMQFPSDVGTTVTARFKDNDSIDQNVTSKREKTLNCLGIVSSDFLARMYLRSA